MPLSSANLPVQLYTVQFDSWGFLVFITNRGVAPRDAKGTYRVRPATSAHPGVGAAASGAPRGAGLRSARAARCRLRVRVSTGDTAPVVGASTGHRTSSGCIHPTCDIEQLARLTVLTVLSQYPQYLPLPLYTSGNFCPPSRTMARLVMRASAGVW